MKNKNLISFAAALIITVCVGLACSNNNNSPSTSSTTTGGDQSASRQNSSDSPVSSGGNTDLSTPTKSHAVMYQAMKSSDIGLYKKTMSKCYLDKAAEFAKRQNITADEFIKNSLNLIPAASIREPAVRNEKISGDKATLEEKDFSDNSRWNTAPYVKETDGWKFNALCGM